MCDRPNCRALEGFCKLFENFNFSFMSHLGTRFIYFWHVHSLINHEKLIVAMTIKVQGQSHCAKNRI